MKFGSTRRRFFVKTKWEGWCLLAHPTVPNDDLVATCTWIKSHPRGPPFNGRNPWFTSLSVTGLHAMLRQEEGAVARGFPIG